VTEAVILVHGLWMNGLDMTLLRRRIAAAGYATHQFRYPTVRQSPAENAHDLATFAKCVEVNLIGTFNMIAKCAAGMMTAKPLDADGELIDAHQREEDDDGFAWNRRLSPEAD
jgi:hypothetical protein